MQPQVQVLEPETLALDMPLTEDERGELSRCENVIERGLPTVFEVGKAFKTIIDRKLYRETHRTAEDYFRERWQLSRPRAYQLIDGATVRENIAEQVSTNGRHIPLPINERQTRALKKIDADKQGELWEKAVTQNNGKPPTAKQIQQVIEQEQEQARKRPYAKPGELETNISGFIRGQCSGGLDAEIEALRSALYGHGRPARDRWFDLVNYIYKVCNIRDGREIRTAAEALFERWQALRDERQQAQVEQEQGRLRQVHEDLSERREAQPEQRMYTARYWKIKIPDDIEVGESGELFAHSRHGERFKREAADDEKAELRAGYWRRHPEKKPADDETERRDFNAYCLFCDSWHSRVYPLTNNEHRGICQSCVTEAMEAFAAPAESEWV
jgi:hypothetical protein